MIVVAGAGAFGTAMACALSANGPVTLLARDERAASEIQSSRVNAARLPGVHLDERISVTADTGCLSTADIILLAIPSGSVAQFTSRHLSESRQPLVACCKGLDIDSGKGPTGLIADAAPRSTPAILTGPSFAEEIGKGLPTAVTLACSGETAGLELQRRLSTPNLRLYFTPDTVGAEVGGALKNVIAIAAGATIGAGFGESARAAILTRGFEEMRKVGTKLGADPTTLAGLSGLGDLILTGMSEKSRNYRYGLSKGAGEMESSGETVEGVRSASAIKRLLGDDEEGFPILSLTARFVEDEITPNEAFSTLLARPLRQER